MPDHHRKRRLPVVHRGRRVPNLYKRPKVGCHAGSVEVFEVVYRDELGKQRQKTLAARTVQRAIVEAEEYRSKVRRGDIIAAPRLTISQIAAEFFDLTESMVSTGQRSQKTVDLYRQRYAKHIDPVIGRKRAQEVRADHVSMIYARQRAAGLAAWTIKGTHTIVSALLTFALTRGYVATNPLTRLSKIETPTGGSERNARRLSEEQLRALCAAASPRYQPIVTTLAWTGLRVSEALALRWQDIDFDAREIKVAWQLDEQGNLKRPKTKAGCRTVPMLPVLEQLLRAHRVSQLAEGFTSGEHFVFTSASGKPLDRHNVRNQGVVPAARRTGLDEPDKATVTTHDLRRTFISHLIVGVGLDPVRVSKIAGHSNVSVTLNTYADEFDKAQHRDDFFTRATRAGFGGIAR